MAVMNTTTGIVYVKSIDRLNIGGTAIGNILLKNSSNQTLDVRTGSDSAYAQVKAASFSVNALGTIKTASDGVFTLYNNAETDFTRLQFGGTTSSFPAIERQGTELNFILADDSAYTAINASNGIFTGAAVIGTTPATAGHVRIPNTGTIQSRNAANDANHVLLSYTSGNFVQVGGTGVNGVKTIGPLTGASDIATPAGGSTTANIQIGSAGVGHYIGTGAPTVSAAKGSIYVRTDATTTTTRLYINTDGGTTWTNFTSAA